MTPAPRARNPETLSHLGAQLRRARKAAGLAQSRVRHMRQGTVCKIENGPDVTLDTLLTYATSLGLEIALEPISQADRLQAKSAANDRAVWSAWLPECSSARWSTSNTPRPISR